MKENVELVFVYNADSSIFAQISDYVHKITFPKTYKCNLCKLTYDNLGEKKEWKNFVQKLPIKTKFLHRDELTVNFPTFESLMLPAILIRNNKKTKVFITSSEINEQKSLNDLKEIIQKKLSIITNENF